MPRVALSLIEIKTITHTERKAPRNANRERVQPPQSPIAVHIVTAMALPEFTPIMPGEASLFDSARCITAPEALSAAPATNAERLRGIRTYLNMV